VLGSTPAGQLSDASIFYILDAANRLDSAAGSIAMTKGTNSEVREHGAMMARDHHKLRQDGQTLATKLAISLAAPAGDTAPASFDKTMATLNGAAKGRDFDKAYIDHEVAYHKTVLETAVSAMAAAQNSELKNLIQKAAPVIQGHLDRAQAIQANLQ
jgi:putative membrane protein